MRNIFIVGLRRSGTTIFWETLRQNKSFVSFDEPFNPLLTELPLQNRKRTRDEFIEVFNRDSEAFRTNFAAIPLDEEFAPGLTALQSNYLKWLLGQFDKPAIVDFTRCTFKIEALHQIDPEAVLIHLFREPGAFATSHLIPSRSRKKLPCHTQLMDWYRKTTFFSRTGGFDSYGYENLYNLNRGRIFEVPSSASALEKLLHIAQISSTTANVVGQRFYQDTFMSLNFEDFTKNPSEALNQLFSLAGAHQFDFDLSGIRLAAERFQTGSPKWSGLY
ncbi:sulfotransferase [Coraliomargarita sp. W4R53]